MYIHCFIFFLNSPVLFLKMRLRIKNYIALTMMKYVFGVESLSLHVYFHIKAEWDK